MALECGEKIACFHAGISSHSDTPALRWSMHHDVKAGDSRKTTQNNWSHLHRPISNLAQFSVRAVQKG